MIRRCLASLVLLTAAGCGLLPEDLTGVWRSGEGVTVSWPVLGFQGRVEVVIGQFGRDAAGMLRLFVEEGEFKDNFLFEPCPCMYLDRVSSDDGALLFDVLPCGSEEVWSGRFDWTRRDGAEVLEGRFEILDDDSGAQSTQDFVLHLAGSEKLIKERELNQGCPAPTE